MIGTAGCRTLIDLIRFLLVRFDSGASVSLGLAARRTRSSAHCCVSTRPSTRHVRAVLSDGHRATVQSATWRRLYGRPRLRGSSLLCPSRRRFPPATRCNSSSSCSTRCSPTTTRTVSSAAPGLRTCATRSSRCSASGASSAISSAPRVCVLFRPPSRSTLSAGSWHWPAPTPSGA